LELLAMLAGLAAVPPAPPVCLITRSDHTSPYDVGSPDHLMIAGPG